MRTTKIIAAVFAMAMLTACGQTNGSSKSSEETAAAPTEVTEADTTAETTAETEAETTANAETVTTAAAETETTENNASGSSDSNAAVMNFIGTYSNGRAMMTINPSSNGASVNIDWAGSAFINSNWTMDGTCTLYGEDLLIAYNNCVKKTTEYDSDGNVVSEETGYSNGTGTVTVHSDGTAEWLDDMEDAGCDSIFTLT